MRYILRLLCVARFSFPSSVSFGAPYAPSVALLDELGCDFCVHGDDDATTSDGKDAFEEVKAAGRMAIVKRTEGVSTTDIVNRLLEVTKQYDSDSGKSNGTDKQPNGTATTSSPSPSSPSYISSPTSLFLATSWRISQFSNHRVPRPTDTIVYISGDYDLFHQGHVTQLAEAKTLGTFLYVGVYDDATFTALYHRPPIMSLYERCLNVLACKYVDEIVIAAPRVITQDIIRTLNIKVVARHVTVDSNADDNVKRNNESSSSDSDKADPLAVVEKLGIVKTIKLPSVIHRANTNVQRRRTYKQVDEQLY